MRLSKCNVYEYTSRSPKDAVPGEKNVKSESVIVRRERVPDDFINLSGTVLHYLGRWVPYTTFCRHHGIHSTFRGLLESTRLHAECVMEPLSIATSNDSFSNWRSRISISSPARSLNAKRKRTRPVFTHTPSAYLSGVFSSSL